MEDISYNISVKNKEYQAAFYQLSKKMDTTGMAKYVREKIKADKKWDDHSRSYKMTNIEMFENQFLQSQAEAVLQDENTPYRVVWFTINEEKYTSGYTIWMYYDNLKNQANGDDL